MLLFGVVIFNLTISKRSALYFKILSFNGYKPAYYRGACGIWWVLRQEDLNVAMQEKEELSQVCATLRDQVREGNLAQQQMQTAETEMREQMRRQICAAEHR